MRNKIRVTDGMRRLLEHARYEVLPTATIEDKVLASVPKDVPVTVTASTGKGLEATLSLAEKFVGHGYSAVPHLAARMISGKSELTDLVQRIDAAGIDTIFVPAGDQTPPAGDYAGAVDLLADLATIEHRFTHIGVTGYPETHPTISDDVAVQAMWDKRKYATHVVSNMTFDATLVQKWVKRMRDRGVHMPLLLGIPGPVDPVKLATMATKIGVGESTRYLVKQRGTLTRLVAPGGYTGESFLAKCATMAARPEALVQGLHVFTFNQVAETENWRQGLLAH
ncbi:MAG: methylenetetrahydrofolate reductase [Actinomycetales bacterium]